MQSHERGKSRADYVAACGGENVDHKAASFISELRVQLTHMWRHGRAAQLRRPRLFNELVQHRKLFVRDPRYPIYADKVGVKAIVEAKLGRDWVTPTLWRGLTLPEKPCWPVPFVVKARHGCGQHAFVREGAFDWEAIRRRAAGWSRSRYGAWLDEWLYGEIERGLLVEEFIGTNCLLPVDYKLFVFGGRVAFVQVHLNREFTHRWILMDSQWRTMSGGNDAPVRPRSLPDMIEAAEILGAGFDFVRVDFYEVAGKPRFGEMTFYPGSGLDPFDPPQLDAVMGSMWLAAKNANRDAQASAGLRQTKCTANFLSG
jgi:hypothetical protein